MSSFFWKFWPFKTCILSRWWKTELSTGCASRWASHCQLSWFSQSDSTSFAPLCYLSESIGIWVCDSCFWDQLRVSWKADSPLEAESKGIIMLPSFESWLFGLAEWQQTSYLAFLSFRFLIGKCYLIGLVWWSNEITFSLSWRLLLSKSCTNLILIIFNIIIYVSERRAARDYKYTYIIFSL